MLWLNLSYLIFYINRLKGFKIKNKKKFAKRLSHLNCKRKKKVTYLAKAILFLGKPNLIKPISPNKRKPKRKFLEDSRLREGV